MRNAGTGKLRGTRIRPAGLLVAELVRKRGIDRIADFVGDVLPHIGDNVGNGAVDLRGQLRGDPVFQLGGEAVIDTLKHTGEDVVRKRIDLLLGQILEQRRWKDR